MAKAKHTPGPWWVEHSRISWWIEAKSDKSRFISGPIPADVWHREADERANCEALQNARLVAAAPETLDQHEINLVDLALLRRAIAEGDPKAELLLRVDDIVRRTTAAIAKATAA